MYTNSMNSHDFNISTFTNTEMLAQHACMCAHTKQIAP